MQNSQVLPLDARPTSLDLPPKFNPHSPSYNPTSPSEKPPSDPSENQTLEECLKVAEKLIPSKRVELKNRIRSKKRRLSDLKKRIYSKEKRMVELEEEIRNLYEKQEKEEAKLKDLVDSEYYYRRIEKSIGSLENRKEDQRNKDQ